jgi:nicotinate-nucleotide pyrophosphorylase (carboxylating)|tara:strand:+ start:2195 stop:3097 length:903 start_codon:yes stop_codon:yes gene_type:complete
MDQGVPTTFFLNSIDRWIQTMITDDRGGDDSTSRLVEAKVIAKEDGIICGHIVIERLIERYVKDCSIQWSLQEGDMAKTGDIILRINAYSSDILKIERVLLNILGKLSGISTSTSKWVSISENIGVACTRKTDWGLLDKWAVHIGGGLTHRLDREDALMLKENDLASEQKNGEREIDTLKRIMKNINLEKDTKFTIIEIRDIEQAVIAAQTWAQLQKKYENKYPIVLLLDNMKIDEIKNIVEKLRRLNLREWCILEGSGGITINSLTEWNTSGVDLVSTSSLNRGVAPLDLSLIIEGSDE